MSLNIETAPAGPVASLNYTGHITLYLPKIVWVERNVGNEVMMHSCNVVL